MKLPFSRSGWFHPWNTTHRTCRLRLAILPYCSPWRGVPWENVSKMAFPTCQWWLFPNETILWKPSLTISYSSWLLLSLSNALLNNKLLSLPCLSFTFPWRTVLVRSRGAPPFLEMGVGKVRKEKGNVGHKASRVVTFPPFIMCVHWAVLFLFCNGFFCGKLTFWLNRSNSHWVLILSLPGDCVSPKVTSTG